MVVGAARVELHVHGSQSLKEKRGVVRSITQRVRNRFNISVAEVGGQDTWQRAELGVACVSTDQGYAHGQLEAVVRFIERIRPDAPVGGYEIEML